MILALTVGLVVLAIVLVTAVAGYFLNKFNQP